MVNGVAVVVPLTASLCVVAICLLCLYTSPYVSIPLSVLILLAAITWTVQNGYQTLGIGRNPYRKQIQSLILDKSGLSDGNVSTTVRFVCISDTHNRQDEMKVPEGDVLLHAGDFTMDGTAEEVKAFNDWIGKLPHKHKIVIAGNHDLIMDPNLTNSASNSATIASPFSDEEIRAHGKKYLSNCTYLYNESITVEGVRIFGSPHLPPLFGQFDKFIAFASNIETRAEIYANVPETTDVMLTHGPPSGILDRMFYYRRAGCPVLASQILEVAPQFSVFGHIHSSYGVQIDEKLERKITYINASICTSLYHATHDYIVFDFVVENKYDSC